MARPMDLWTRDEWAKYYGFNSIKRIAMLNESLRKQLANCADEEARRILLGVKPCSGTS